MNPEAVLISAYALATQERHDEAERLLESCPEAGQSVSGQDLLARIRLAQGRADQARQIWNRILSVEPTNPEAKAAIDALDHPICDPLNPYRKFVIAGVIAVALGIVISIVGALNRPVPVVVAQEQRTVFVTNVVERVQTNTVIKTETKVVEVEKPVERIVERVLTNIVDRTVEVPAVSVITQYIDRVVEVVPQATNEVVVLQDQSSSVIRQTHSETNMPVVVEHENVEIVVEKPEAENVKRVYCPVYVIKAGDQIGRLAQKFGFRMPDFRVVNPDVDPDYIIIGQEVKIPGFFSEEDMPK